ncbi:MAG TPA: 7TM diverse intracellular signaling domain-containing protein [Telluria sp.]|jgi:signal transduction histidine kinase
MFLPHFVMRCLPVLAALMCLCLPARAVDGVALDRIGSAGGLSGAQLGLQFLRDTGPALSIDAVRTQTGQRFQVLRPSDVNQRFQRGDYWLKTSFHNTADASISWVLRHPMPLTDHVEYWVYVNGALRTHAVGGDRTRVAERQIPYRMASVRHTSAAGEVAQVYIRLHNQEMSPMHLTFALSDEPTFWRETGNDQLMLGVFYGIPLVLVLYALGGWCINRSRGSLIYAAYVLAVLGCWLGLNGQLADYVFVDRPDLANAMLVVFFLLVTISNCMFARAFLQTRRFLPRMDKFFIGTIIAGSAGILLRMLGLHVPVVQLAVILVFVHAIAPVVAILALGPRARLARWYLPAQLVYNAALIIGIVGMRFGALSYENYFFYCQLAFIAELVLLGVAQLDSMRILRRDKAAFEHKYHGALERSNAQLAGQLAQRTAQLEEAQQRSAFLATVKTATGRIANGEFGVRLACGQSPELAELAGNVNAMAASLSRLEGARKRWIADISHELRLPLFSLLCETEALLDGIRTMNRQAVGSIHEEVLRLSRLVSDLHEVALSHLRPLPCTFSNWEPAVLLLKKNAEHARQAQAKGLQFTLDLPADGPRVQWDQGRIEQLLDNLVQNSISYTDAPGVIVLALQAGPERVTITLEDSAPGPAPEDLMHLFEPLYRAETARSRRAGGSGLGLSICQSIVHAHHGQINAAPSALGGLAIRIELPLFAKEK